MGALLALHSLGGGVVQFRLCQGQTGTAGKALGRARRQGNPCSLWKCQAWNGAPLPVSFRPCLDGIHSWPTLQTEMLTQIQRTQSLRPLGTILLISLPLHVEGETEALRVVKACSRSLTCLWRARTDVHPSLAPFRVSKQAQLSLPTIPMSQPSASTAVGKPQFPCWSKGRPAGGFPHQSFVKFLGIKEEPEALYLG